MLRKAVGGWCLVAPQMQADDTLVVREIASVSPVKQQCINVLCEAHHHIIYCHIYVSRWSKEHELKVLIPSPQSFPPTSGLENTFRLTCIISLNSSEDIGYLAEGHCPAKSTEVALSDAGPPLPPCFWEQSGSGCLFLHTSASRCCFLCTVWWSTELFQYAKLREKSFCQRSSYN